MRSGWIIGLALVCMALPASAQRGDRGRQERPGFGRQRGPRGHQGRMSPDALLHRLPSMLELDDAQRAQFDEIAAKYLAQFEERQGQREEIRALAEQYREARRSGDDARANEIRAQMREFGGGRGQLINAFFDELTPILRDDQREKLAQFRERMGPGGPRGPDLRRLVRDLPDQLELNDEQRAAFDKLVAEQRELSEQNRERWLKMRPLIQEMREARDAGEDERADEIQRELEEKRRGRPNAEALFDKLEPILTDEQKAKLAELRASYMESRGRGSRDAGSILRAAKQLDLTAEQRERLKEIMRDVEQAKRVRMDREAREELARLVKGQITELLDADQATEFERLLERGKRGGRHEGRGRHRGDRPGRGGGQGGGQGGGYRGGDGDM